MAEEVASRSLLLDEFLAQLADDGQLELNFREPPAHRQRVLFHGHCHQKALAQPLASVRLLRLAGDDAELINAACCGMAARSATRKNTTRHPGPRLSREWPPHYAHNPKPRW